MVAARNVTPGGFTLIELLGVIALMSVLASLVGPALINMQLKRSDQMVLDRAAEQLSRLAQAAQRHALDNTGVWPDEANACAGAYATLNGASRIPGIPTTDPWGNNWIISCTAGGDITVSATADNNRNAELVANSVTGATVTGNRVTGNWPLPAALPALDALLPRDGSRAMTGNLDMDNNNIGAAGEITTEGLSVTREIMPQYVQMDSRTFQLGTLIPKPSCASGGSPRILLHVHGLRADEIYTYGEMAWARDQCSQWRIDPYRSWDSQVVGVATTHCYYATVSGR